MAKNDREVLDGLQLQGANESIAYSIDTEPWGGTPSSPVHDIFDEEDLTTSLKSTLMSGSPTVSSHNVVLPALSGITDGVIYKVIVRFVSGGQTLEGYFRVKGEA